MPAAWRPLGTFRHRRAIISCKATFGTGRSAKGFSSRMRSRGLFTSPRGRTSAGRSTGPGGRGDPARGFLHIATDEVLGSPGPDAPPFSEVTPYAPTSPYAASKAASDHLVWAYHPTYALPTLITNCPNNYGPYQYPEKLIPLMILNALDGKPLPLYGDGGQIRDWLYVEDHCEGLLDVLEKGRVGETSIIGGGVQPTNLEIVTELCAILDQTQ